MSADPIALNMGKMFIGGLSPITNENASRGFGFITFRDPEVLDLVLSVTPHIVDGKEVDCKRAVPKEASQQFQQQMTMQQSMKRGIIPQQKKQSQNMTTMGGGNPNNQQNKQKQKQQQQQNQQQQFKKTLQQQQQMIQEQKQQIELLYQQQLQQQKKQFQQQNNQYIQDNQSDQQQYSHQKQNSGQISLTNSGQFSLQQDQKNQVSLNQQLTGSYEEQLSPTGSFQDPDIPNNSPSFPANPIETQYRKIFVGGLPHNLSDEEFKQYFEVYGEIEDSAILKDKRTGKPRGFGFVTYKDLQSLEQVMDRKDDHVIQGKWVDCKRAVPANQMKEQISQESKPIVKDMQLSQKFSSTSTDASNQSMQTPQPPPQNYNNQYNYSPNPFASKPSPNMDQNKNVGNFQQYQQQPQQQMQQPNMNQQMPQGYPPQQYGNWNQYQNPMMQNQQQQQQQQMKPNNQYQQQQNWQDPSKYSNFNQSSQPFYRNNNQMSPPQQQQYQNPPPGFNMVPQYQQGIQPNISPGQNPSYVFQNQNPYYGYQQQQQQQQWNNNQQFKSGWPYSSTYQQQMQQQPNLNQNPQATPVQDAMYRKQQEQTECHIESLNSLYSKLNMDDSDEKQGGQSQNREQYQKIKKDTIDSFNEQIKSIEEMKEDKYESKSDFQWQDDNSNKLSGFYTNYQPNPQQQNNQGEPKYQQQRSFQFQPVRGSSQDFHQSPSKNEYDTPQPQEAISDTHSEKEYRTSKPMIENPPTLKRVESDGNIGNQPEVQQLRGRNILGSGKDFQYGKDRPNSKAVSDKAGKAKPEYGQIRSEAFQGPSKRADRQYKPF